MSDRLNPEVVVIQASPESGTGEIGWTCHETVGVGIVNPILLLPEEERRRKLAELDRAGRERWEHGEPALPGAPHVCPNGCAGPFRTHGKGSTLLGWVGGLDPNHWTEECSCEACGARFTKEWVWARNHGRPWYSVREGGRRICYHGEPACCEECYTMREPK